MRVAFAVFIIISSAAVAADRVKNPERTRIAVLEVKALDPASNVAARIASEVVSTEVAAHKRLNPMSSSDIAAILGMERQKQLMGCAQEGAALSGSTFGFGVSVATPPGVVR